jgi:hypothetical protein
MVVWWQRAAGPQVKVEAQKFLELHGDAAYDFARREARAARKSRDHAKGRHYSYVAACISDLTKCDGSPGVSGESRGSSTNI